MANSRTNEALKFNSSFNLLSVSEQFCAMMIMQLKEAYENQNNRDYTQSSSNDTAIDFINEILVE